MLKSAIKYGMSPRDFWNSTYEEYTSYEEAYVEALHEKAHIEGLYNYIALETIVANLFKNKSDKPSEYPQMNIYTQEKEKINKQSTIKPKETITKENINQVMKNRLMGCY